MSRRNKYRKTYIYTKPEEQDGKESMSMERVTNYSDRDLWIDVAANTRVAAAKLTNLERDFSDMKNYNASVLNQFTVQNETFRQQILEYLKKQDESIHLQKERLDNQGKVLDDLKILIQKKEDRLYRIFYFCTGFGASAMILFSVANGDGKNVIKLLMKYFNAL